MSEEMLHEVLCTYLHDKVENAWDEASNLVDEIKKGAADEAAEDYQQIEDLRHDAPVQDTRDNEEWMEDQELGI
jgi:hypothetical protein